MHYKLCRNKKIKITESSWGRQKMVTNSLVLLPLGNGVRYFPLDYGLANRSDILGLWSLSYKNKSCSFHQFPWNTFSGKPEPPRKKCDSPETATLKRPCVGTAAEPILPAVPIRSRHVPEAPCTHWISPSTSWIRPRHSLATMRS